MAVARQAIDSPPRKERWRLETSCETWCTSSVWASRRPRPVPGSFLAAAEISDPAVDSPGSAAPLRTTAPAATGARVLDAPARQSSNTDRLPGLALGQTVREPLLYRNRPARDS